MDWLNQILCGHVLTVATTIPNESVSCGVTSPPYWAKRDYKESGESLNVIWDGDTDCGHKWGKEKTTRSNPGRDVSGQLSSGRDMGTRGRQSYNAASSGKISQGRFCIKCGAWRGQLGHEPTVDMYIQHLMQIFDEMHRILRKDGNLFVVIADTRSRGTRPKQANWEDSLRKRKDIRSLGDRVAARARKSTLNISKDRSKSQTFIPLVEAISTEPNLRPHYMLPSKSQCCVPELFKLAMMSHGWIARSTYVWVKTNPKPESVKDRFTDCFEYIYHFVKHKRYFFDMRYEPTVNDKNWNSAKCFVPHGKCGTSDDYKVRRERHSSHPDCDQTLRQMRGAFIGPIQPYKGAHFATYPEWLIEPLIRAGCPTKICKRCGRVAKPIYETRKVRRERLHDTTEPCKEAGQSPNDYAGSTQIAVDYDTCNCAAGWRTGVVFDPFMGAGTTAVVAEKLGLDWSGVELSKSYIKMSYRRLSK